MPVAWLYIWLEIERTTNLIAQVLSGTDVEKKISHLRRRISPVWGHRAIAADWPTGIDPSALFGPFGWSRVEACCPTTHGRRTTRTAPSGACPDPFRSGRSKWRWRPWPPHHTACGSPRRSASGKTRQLKLNEIAPKSTIDFYFHCLQCWTIKTEANWLKCGELEENVSRWPISYILEQMSM